MTDGVAPVSKRADPALVQALARAFRYQRMLDQGRFASITEMAAAERIERGYLGSLLHLTLLAPDIVEAVLDGLQAEGLVLPRLLNPLPAGWTDQEKALDVFLVMKTNNGSVDSFWGIGGRMRLAGPMSASVIIFDVRAPQQDFRKLTSLVTQGEDSRTGLVIVVGALSQSREGQSSDVREPARCHLESPADDRATLG